MNNNLETAIGTHISTAINNYDWQGYWPEVDNDGYITAILDGDSIPDDAVMVNWDGKRLIETDGQHGFEAVLV